MKKLLCIALSFVILLSFAACKNEDKTSSESGIDLEYYADSGKIPECDYALGTDVEKVKQELSDYAESEEGAESLYDVIEGDENSYITNGNYNFYYKNDNEEDGISYIVSFGKAYGFETGEIILNVKEALSGIEYTEEEINDDNAFFLFVPIEGSVIKCEFEKNTIMFVFENNALCATAIYNNDF